MHDNNCNLFHHFKKQIRLHADKELLQTVDGRSYTYADVDRLSGRIAHFLSSLGALPGDRVSVQVEKSPESLCLYLACLRAGFVFHPLNMGYQQGELEYFLGNAEPSIVVCDPVKKKMIATVARSVGAKHLLTLDADGGGTLTDSANEISAEFDTITRNWDDLAALLYSSGTTGVPKGIMLTHGNLLSNTEALVQAWGFSAGDRLLHALPIFHVHGLFVAIGCVMQSGASMRWLPTFDAGEVIRFLPECTVMMGVPTYYVRLLAEESFTREVAEPVRLFVSGSAPLLQETFIAFETTNGSAHSRALRDDGNEHEHVESVERSAQSRNGWSAIAGRCGAE